MTSRRQNTGTIHAPAVSCVVEFKAVAPFSPPPAHGVPGATTTTLDQSLTITLLVFVVILVVVAVVLLVVIVFLVVLVVLVVLLLVVVLLVVLVVLLVVVLLVVFVVLLVVVLLVVRVSDQAGRILVLGRRLDLAQQLGDLRGILTVDPLELV